MLFLMILHLLLVDLRTLLDEWLHNLLVFSIYPRRLLLLNYIVKGATHHHWLVICASIRHTEAKGRVWSLSPKKLLRILKTLFLLSQVVNKLFCLNLRSLHLRNNCVGGYWSLITHRLIVFGWFGIQANIIYAVRMEQRLRSHLEGTRPAYCLTVRRNNRGLLYASFRAHVKQRGTTQLALHQDLRCVNWLYNKRSNLNIAVVLHVCRVGFSGGGLIVFGSTSLSRCSSLKFIWWDFKIERFTSFVKLVSFYSIILEVINQLFVNSRNARTSSCPI